MVDGGIMRCNALCGSLKVRASCAYVLVYACECVHALSIGHCDDCTDVRAHAIEDSGCMRKSSVGGSLVELANAACEDLANLDASHAGMYKGAHALSDCGVNRLVS